MDKNSLFEEEKYLVRPSLVKIKSTLIVEGKGAIVTDIDGNQYIDNTAGAMALPLGHSHPHVVEAIKNQAEKIMQLTLIQTNIPAIKLAAKIANLSPGRLKKVFYAVGGSEAIEASIKMARQFTGKHEIVALRYSFHGLGFGSVAATGMSTMKTGWGPTLPGVLHAVAPYCYRCPFAQEYPDCNIRCADDIEEVIRFDSTGDVAAVLLEPMLGAGGAIIPPKEYMVKVRKICDRNGLLLIVDEIQTGFGRTGKMFAIEHYDVEPDLMVLGKAVGGGLPCSAVVTREEIIGKFKSYIYTFAGNALVCAAGLATLEIIEKENLPKKAYELGRYMEDEFSDFSKKSKLIGDVRIKGVWGGIELVKDKKTKVPAVEEATKVVDKLLEKKILTFPPSGVLGNVIRIMCPLTITNDQIETLIEKIKEAILEVS